MSLFRADAAGFAALAHESTLASRIADQMRHRTGRHAGPSEVRSWQASLPVLANDLVQAGLDRVEVLVEHQLPLSSKRVDVVLVGQHPRTRQPSYVVIELKQWTAAHAYEGEAALVNVPSYGQPVLHPVAQVRGYCQYLVDFTKSLHDVPDAVTGAAYLHNATDDGAVADLRDYPQDRYGRLFTGAGRAQWLDFLRQQLDDSVAGAPYADVLLQSASAPSKQLLAVAADEVQRREQFVLLDRQRLAYELVLHAVERSRREDRKSVVVVTGGPGSGKSVIALSLLGELARRGRTVVHATGSRSFTQTLRKVAGARSESTKRLFKYFNDFMEAERNGLDVLVLDEAHRIRETSVSRWTRKEFRDIARPQVDELMAAARVPVFLLDQHQVVRPGELGTVEDIEQHARALGLEVHRVDLDAQFRCGGSALYMRWVLRLLGLESGGPTAWTGDDAFEVRFAETAEETERLLAGKLAEGYSARMTAGYCWPWSDPRPDGSLVPDVEIDGWARPWNLKGNRSIGGAPPAALWATDPGGFDQVGCVYTAQGFEYDWNGVILGPDLVWRDGRWETQRQHNKDPDFRNTKRVDDGEFDRLVRNVYKVLLTRGMVGTVITSTDPETRQFLRSLLVGQRAVATV
ncbi:MAG: DNA/RNA helicase domain-containing protein [Actinomycetes bacterium]